MRKYMNQMLILLFSITVIFGNAVTVKATSELEPEDVVEQEKIAPEEKKTVEMAFYIDTNKGYFAGAEGEMEIILMIDTDSEEEYPIPKVVVKEGYVFKGWRGMGKDPFKWGPDRTTFTVKDLGDFGDGSNEESSYAYAEAVIRSENEPLMEASADVSVDLEKGYFTDWGKDVDHLEFHQLEEKGYVLEPLPKVTANKGYRFTGWQVVDLFGDEVQRLGADATSVKFPYNKSDYYTVIAQFAAEEIVDPEPQPPVEQEQPVDSEKPVDKVEEQKPVNKDPDQKPVEEAVKTGDTSMVYTYVVVMLGAALVMTIAVAKKRNQR